MPALFTLLEPIFIAATIKNRIFALPNKKNGIAGKIIFRDRHRNVSR